jgi:hypothetical protein
MTVPVMDPPVACARATPGIAQLEIKQNIARAMVNLLRHVVVLSPLPVTPISGTRSKDLFEGPIIVKRVPMDRRGQTSLRRRILMQVLFVSQAMLHSET